MLPTLKTCCWWDTLCFVTFLVCVLPGWRDCWNWQQLCLIIAITCMLLSLEYRGWQKEHLSIHFPHVAHVCMWLSFFPDCSTSFIFTLHCWEKDGERGGDKGGKGKESEVPPLWNPSVQGWIPYWDPSGFVLLSASFVCARVCICVCMSSRKSVVLVLLSTSGVSLVSHQPPLSHLDKRALTHTHTHTHTPSTSHILSDGPSGQSMNLSTPCFGVLSQKPQQAPKMDKMPPVKAELPRPHLKPEPLVFQEMKMLSMGFALHPPQPFLSLSIHTKI